ncbi:NYN domain-containing protein [Cupriavidus pauculus]|uniref:NYN domain-containing protein n=1 Tax=Cupriavidus pauculus TaxID=82633 RepID=A0A5P2H6Y0_9BURK|nr:NYN domain-containing protein [Cupriavidus pauculus]QET03364.1 NYN domain-containing protein [Cupriavidus pauculus]
MTIVPRQGTATLAVLIDADNATPAIVEGLLAEVAKYGVAAVKRIYGDWTKPNLAGWKEKLLSHSIQPIQQFRYTVGKNATDSAMIIDAMDLLYTGRFQGFCIVSSDSDFTRLASRIREQGLTVYGFGERKTPKPFVTACDKFIYSDVLRAEVDVEGVEGVEGVDGAEGAVAPARRRNTGELRQDSRLVRLLQSASKAVSDEDGWSTLGGMGNHIAKQAPEFDSRNYGYGKLSELVAATGLFEVETRNGGNNKTIWVRLKKRNKGGGQDVKPPQRPVPAPASDAAFGVDLDEVDHAPAVPAAAPDFDDEPESDLDLDLTPEPAPVTLTPEVEENAGSASTLIPETVDEGEDEAPRQSRSRGKRTRRPEVTLGDKPWPIDASVFAAPGNTVVSARPETAPVAEPESEPESEPAVAPAIDTPEADEAAPAPARKAPAKRAPRKRAPKKAEGSKKAEG